VKCISVQRLTPRGLARLEKVLVTLANTEGLKAHAYSVEARFEPASGTARNPSAKARNSKR
jgi:histidinol dehydrogenase